MTDDGDRLTRQMRRDLDALRYGELVSRLGPSKILTTYAAGMGNWVQGDGPPAIRPDTPADAQAIGRCAASRTRFGKAEMFSAAHPGPCAWCDYPMTELLKACDWASWSSRYVVDEVGTWAFADGTYVRSTGRSGEYDNPEWQAFFHGATPATEGLPPSERSHQRALRATAIARAAGYPA